MKRKKKSRKPEASIKVNLRLLMSLIAPKRRALTNSGNHPCARSIELPNLSGRLIENTQRVVLEISQTSTHR